MPPASGIVQLETPGPLATERLGAVLAGHLPEGTVLALYGPIGAGKTCLVRGMASALGAASGVSSPTFTLVQEYATEPKLFHLDLYRLTEPADLVQLGFEELFDRPPGICVIEWAERAGALLPEHRIDLRLAHAGGDRRHFELADLRIDATTDWAGVLREFLKKIPEPG
ncbi:MAG: tRNA (adenosine(37)-N6)-threonylcarbamoyltransferase complex ATPase subunit type 1 TsaE [Candidatus Hydrogenedentales bacterium]